MVDQGLSISEKLGSLPIINEVGADNNLLNEAKAKGKFKLKEILH